MQLDFLGDLRRTHSCGQLRVTDAGSRALVMGWVHRRRDLGGVFFIHLRDRDGVTQLVFRSEMDPAVHAKAESLGPEYVIAAEGHVEKRSPETINPNIPTGEVEIVVDKIWILNESRTPPFPMDEAIEVKEDKGNLLVTAELPGVNYEDIKLYFTGDALVVEGGARRKKRGKGTFTPSGAMDASTARFQCRKEQMRTKQPPSSTTAW